MLIADCYLPNALYVEFEIIMDNGQVDLRTPLPLALIAASPFAADANALETIDNHIEHTLEPTAHNTFLLPQGKVPLEEIHGPRVLYYYFNSSSASSVFVNSAS